MSLLFIINLLCEYQKLVQNGDEGVNRVKCFPDVCEALDSVLSMCTHIHTHTGLVIIANL